jgi:hypothetical protein
MYPTEHYKSTTLIIKHLILTTNSKEVALAFQICIYLLTQASCALLHPVRPSVLLVPSQFEVSIPCSEMDSSLVASALWVALFK